MNKIISRNRLAKIMRSPSRYLVFLLLAILAVFAGQAFNHLFHPDAAWGLAALLHGGAPLVIGLVWPKLWDYDSTTADLNPGSNLLIGTSRKAKIPRDYPIEEARVILEITANATPPSSPTADGWLKLLKRVQVYMPFPGNPRNVVDCSGNFLLEYSPQVGLNNDTPTLAALGELNKATPALIASNKYRICYRIPFVQPQLAEPLRTRFLLPVHTLRADPMMLLDFASAAEMYSVGVIDTVTCEIQYCFREINDIENDRILNDGGFMNYDLLETSYVVPVGVSGERTFDVPIPGYYLGLMMRHYKGANPVVRGDISQSVTPGSETQWTLRVAKRDRIKFRMKHIALVNDESRAKNNITQTTSPSFSGPIAANTQYQDPNSLYLDLMNDGHGQVNELGGVLDGFTPNDRSQLVQIYGFVSAPATNAHTLYVGGHRILDRDIKRWQAIK